MDGSRRAQWLRGVLDLCLLASLAGGERYGYDLAQHLEGAGIGKVRGGTLYPVLARLERAGLVRTAWRQGEAGPNRKYYALTAEGRRFLARHSGEWRSFSQTVNRLMQAGEKG